MENEFSELTIQITKQISKATKKEQGIFITPRTIISKLVNRIAPYIDNDRAYNLLEPSCGTCEIVNFLDKKFDNISIDAVEQNSTIYNSINLLTFKNRVKLINNDFIKYKPSKSYDFIFGNPPYVVIDKNNIPNEYAEYIVGRPNLFGLFILHSLSMLKVGGILAFIIPKSFLNSAYYSKIRNFMKEDGTIIDIIDFEKDNNFIDTQQSTFGIIFQKTALIVPVECPYSIKFGDNFMFSDNATYLREIMNGSTNLKSLGLKVKTGNIVWNQKKSILTSDSSKTLLLYNSNIAKTNSVQLLEFSNDEKKQYISMEGSNDPVIIVNRGNGNAAYSLNYAYIDGSRKYLAENHLNVIYSDTIHGEELKKLFDKIVASFKNPKTEQFIKMFLGNNGLSKTELETLFPIFV